MPGLTFSNELIAGDEGLHCDFACLLYSFLNTQLTHERVTMTIREAVVIEKEFFCDSLPADLIGMNKKLMAPYILFYADRLPASVDVETFLAKNPFDWMLSISLQ
jgi:ribonucleotide reductase beta subunit family protein with ferritin-like domain